MAVIHVPRPSKRKGMNPDRPVSSLLLTQVGHLQHAERRLPLRYRTATYTHAIKTEGEAAAYIREVTEAIHQAHQDARAQRGKVIRRKGGLQIAAAAEKAKRKSTRKKRSKPAKKKSPKK